jgi:Phage terminase, small subunit
MAKLRVVTGQSPGTKCSRKLSKPGAALWRDTLAEYEISDCAGLEMLALACQQLDRAEECAQRIDRDGLMVSTRHGPKEHPLLKAELSARSFVVRTLARLGLSLEAVKPVGRPPSSRHWQPDFDADQ